MQFSIWMRRGIRKIAIGSDPFELTTVTVLGRFALLGECGLQFATHQITILINCKLQRGHGTKYPMKGTPTCLRQIYLHLIGEKVNDSVRRLGPSSNILGAL